MTGVAGAPADRPGDIDRYGEAQTVLLDVRDDIRRGQEPFEKIMAAVRALPAGHALRLHAPFEPGPLYDVLARRGFAHWGLRQDDGSWMVWFYRPATDAPPTTVLDVRGLEPPEPMVRVLAAADRLQPGQTLEVHHGRRPVFLYPQLDARGLRHVTDEPEPGLVRIRVSRAPSP